MWGFLTKLVELLEKYYSAERGGGRFCQIKAPWNLKEAKKGPWRDEGPKILKNDLYLSNLIKNLSYLF